MTSFILIFLCLFLGLIFRVFKIFPDTTAMVLNRFVIYISLPALTIKALHQITFSSEQIPAIAMSWILFILGLLFFKILSLHFKWNRQTHGAVILTGSLGNTSFVGFPLLEALFGASSLSVGILVDQPGTFLVAGTLGIFVASFFSGKTLRTQELIKKVILFPPFQAVILSVFIHSYQFPTELNALLEKLAATLIPLSLVAVGFQIKVNTSSLRREWKPLVAGLGFKLLLAPIIMTIIYVGFFNMHTLNTRIILVESAMAPMITAGILATEYNLNTELSSLMIGLGIPLSMLTVPLWNYILGFIV